MSNAMRLLLCLHILIYVSCTKSTKISHNDDNAKWCADENSDRNSEWLAL